MKDINQIRLDAAQILEDGAWCQGSYKKATPAGCAYCMIGACREAAGYYVLAALAAARYSAAIASLAERVDAADAAERAAAAALAAAAVPNDPVRWNDEDGRTKEEVIAALRKGLVTCETSGQS